MTSWPMHLAVMHSISAIGHAQVGMSLKGLLWVLVILDGNTIKGLIWVLSVGQVLNAKLVNLNKGEEEGWTWIK